MPFRMPVDIRDLVRSGSQIQEVRERPVRLAMFIEMDAPDELIEAVKSAFRPHTANATLHIEVVEPDVKLLVDPSVDAVIALVGSGKAGIVEQVKAARERAIPTAAIAVASSSTDVAEMIDHPYRDTLADPDPETLVDVELGEWLVERLPDKRLALAANFSFMRRAVALEAVKNTAWQNGLIGVVAIFPGADMPLMTANQAKMVLQIAAAYGEDLGMERARELLGVVGGAFVFRAAARQFVTFAPGFGWAIKGGIAAAGTLAVGYAAMAYFENDADLPGLSERFERMRKKLPKRFTSRRMPAYQPVTGVREQQALLPVEEAADVPEEKAVSDG